MQFQICKDEQKNVFVEVLTTQALQKQKMVQLDDSYHYMFDIKQDQNKIVYTKTVKLVDIQKEAENNENIDHNNQQEGNISSVLLVSKQGKFCILNTNGDQILAQFKLSNAKNFQFVYDHNTLLLVTTSDVQVEQLVQNSIEQIKPVIKDDKQFSCYVFKIIGNKFVVQLQMTIDFLPDKIAVSQNSLALYQRKILENEKNKKLYKLHCITINNAFIVQYAIFDNDKRIKTLHYDSNGDLIIITKSRKDRYFFTRYTQDQEKIYDKDNEDRKKLIKTMSMSNFQSRTSTSKNDNNNSDSKNKTDELEISDETTTTTTRMSITQTSIQQKQTGDHKLIQNRNQIPIDQVHPMILSEIPIFNFENILQASDQLEYQFRTVVSASSFVVSGRFDTYLLMQKRVEPLNAVLHAHNIKKPCCEKLAVAGTDNGYIIASITPECDAVNIYRNYKFEQQLYMDQQYSFAQHAKIKDLIVDQNNQLIVLTQKRHMVNMGQLTQLIQRIQISDSVKFCSNQDFTELVIQSKKYVYYAYFENKAVIWSKAQNITAKPLQQAPNNDIQVADLGVSSSDQNQHQNEEKIFQPFNINNQITGFKRSDSELGKKLLVYYKDQNGLLQSQLLQLE